MEGATANRLVRGSATYISNLRRPDALWMHVVRSDVPHGMVTALDATAVRQAPGVVAVRTAGDLDVIPTIPIRVGSTPLLSSHLQPVIAAERVRYVGEPLAIVVAISPAAAEHAAGLLIVDIAPLPAGHPDRPVPLWDDLPDSVMVDVAASDGDVDAVLAGSAAVVDLELSTDRKTGLPIEPRGLLAEWVDDSLHVWGVTKFVNFTARTLASMFGIGEERVICHRVDVGGMFGVRGEFYPEDYLVAWAAATTGRPVRWEEHRRDHMTAINHAGAQRLRIRLGVDADGRLCGLDADVSLDMGAYPRPIGSRIAHIVLETLPGPYRWEAFRVRCRGIATNRTPTGTVRGPAAFETTFARERAVDALARRAGLDPMAVRRASLVSSDDIPFRRSGGHGEPDLVFDSGDFPAVYDGLVERAGLTEWTDERDRRRGAGERVGIGHACFIIHSALGGEETVGLELDTDGRFLIRTSATDVGQGLDRMAVTVLARAGGVPEHLIDVASGDTFAPAGGKGTYSSRSTVFVANALVDAWHRLAGGVARGTADLLGGLPLDAVTLTPDGPTDGTTTLSWKEVAPHAAVGKFTTDRPTYGFGATVSLVSVDEETGVVTPERIAVAYDCGRALDPAVVADQLRGAAVMGVGAALFERFTFAEDGVPQSATLSDYLIPTASGLPVIDTFVFETAPAAGNPLGVKGVGEAGVIGVGGAIANAVADALVPDGDRLVRSLPIDRETIALAGVA